MGMGPFLAAEKVLFWFSQRLYAFRRGYMNIFRRGYMHFAEAIYNFAEAICSFCENIDQLSPVEAGAGTGLGNTYRVLSVMVQSVVELVLVHCNDA